MAESISFVCYVHPEPQGSSKAFVIKGTNRAVVTSDNKKLKPFRQEVKRTAMAEVPRMPWAEKHVPVKMDVTFRLAKPASVSKKRTYPVVRPDLDKCVRALADSLTGVMWQDDSQLVSLTAHKVYGDPEGVEVTVTMMEPPAGELFTRGAR